MNPFSLAHTAAVFAERAHAGQTRRDGETPYFTHVQRVANSMTSEEDKAVAYLHDVLEDADVYVVDLEQAGFPAHIIEAIVAITKVRGEDYVSYLARVKANPIARRVKIEDMLDNLSDQPSSNQFKRYMRGLLFLNS